MSPEQIEAELKHLATKDDLASLRAEILKDFGDFKTDIQKQFGGLITTIWITQLSTIGIILIGVGLLIHFKL
jgi:hypothetical protein